MLTTHYFANNFKMIKSIDPKVEYAILTLSKNGFTHRKIQEQLEHDGYKISLGTISNVMNKVGLRRNSGVLNEKMSYKTKPRTARTTQIIKKVKIAINTPNPPTQNQLSRKLKVSQAVINRIIHEDLNCVTRKKTKVHKLKLEHMKNRKINTRKFYENHLAKDRSEYVVTLDEAYMYLNYCNGERKICYVERGETPPETWMKYCKERFPVGFMVDSLTGRGTLPLIKVPNNVN